ncbi:hypothetical protein TH66_14100 [Carbonactinospora thermoautotrophica]|uniref:Uncharacterized protein n=1 Tax=Carbonactinospora thermoautotrophica TaxID=1469144 RepID=A0A132MRP9_9ACTN|nr:hypothetical protein [Carbonactinospora thermoautotrophica]KWX00072.1 hypothetical protein TH66_14100 [Carbonactinospora thermoautotrophica]KWX10328.1 hypothetical protein TR74_04270 [Carbonactinospora thermoautotrophica]
MSAAVLAGLDALREALAARENLPGLVTVHVTSWEAYVQVSSKDDDVDAVAATWELASAILADPVVRVEPNGEYCHYEVHGRLGELPMYVMTVLKKAAPVGVAARSGGRERGGRW